MDELIQLVGVTVSPTPSPVNGVYHAQVRIEIDVMSHHVIVTIKGQGINKKLAEQDARQHADTYLRGLQQSLFNFRANPDWKGKL